MNGSEGGQEQSAASVSLQRLAHLGATTVRERHQQQEPRCGFGELGLCCRHCFMGPCRIDPFGDGPQLGVCGATADTVAARGFLRAIAAGASAHADHGRHVAESFLCAARGAAPGYGIRDEARLLSLASRMAIKTPITAMTMSNSISVKARLPLLFSCMFAPLWERVPSFYNMKSLGVAPLNPRAPLGRCFGVRIARRNRVLVSCLAQQGQVALALLAPSVAKHDAQQKILFGRIA